MSFPLPTHEEPAEVRWWGDNVAVIRYGETGPEGRRRGLRTWGVIIPGVWICLTDRCGRRIPHVAFAREKTAMDDLAQAAKADPWYQMTKEKWSRLDREQRHELWNVAISQQRHAGSLMSETDILEVLDPEDHVQISNRGDLRWSIPPADFTPTHAYECGTWGEWESKELDRLKRLEGQQSPDSGIERGGLQR